MKGRGNKKRETLKLFPLLMLLLLFIGAYILVTQYLEYRNVQIELEKNQAKLKEYQELNESLKDEKSKIQSPEEVEKKAREDLGLVRPGEIPVRPIPAK